MKNLAALVLALVLAACSAPETRLPDFVTCNDVALAAVNDRTTPERANPDSPEFDSAFAIGYFLAAGCEVGEASQ